MSSPDGTLIATIRQEIAAYSPLPLDRYMALCNTHYYATRDPFGVPKDQGGDFTTAPEISQLFGELLGLWAVNEWERLGSPQKFALLELGPGRGTLMRDALRAARVRPAFLKALQLHFIETSPVLRRAQSEAVGEFGPAWHADLSGLRALPTIAIANEFFDALPVVQVMRVKAGWLQKCVTVAGDTLAWTEQPIAAANVPAHLRDLPFDIFAEHSPPARDIMGQLCAHLAAHGGSAAIIDYGDRIDAAGLRNGDTLQALHKHQPVDPLQDPGMADLTSHVDFGPLSAIARAAGLAISYGTQGDFLHMLGIGPRVAQLCLSHPEQEESLNTSQARLTDADQMGRLFKVLTISSQ